MSGDCEYKIEYSCDGPEGKDGRKSCIACHWTCWRDDYKDGDEKKLKKVIAQ